MEAVSQKTKERVRRMGAIGLGVLLVFCGVFFILTDQIYSINFLIGLLAGPGTIIVGFLLTYVAIFKLEISRDINEIKNEKHIKGPFLRLLTGATIGFVVFAVPCAFLLWRDGWFYRVPCFTPPPGLIVLDAGFIGVVIGALLSMYSHKWES
jgi:hypothetical protein